MIYKSLINRLFILVIFLASALPVLAQPTAATGEQIFKSQCAACHNRNMKDDLTGPALGGFEEGWTDYPREDIYSWIRNSQKMIADGHPKALELWDQWNQIPMLGFTMTDDEIESVLLYINNVYEFGCGEPPCETEVAETTVGVAAEKPDNTLLFVVLFAVLAILSIILARVITSLNNLEITRKEGVVPDKRTLKDILTSRGVVGFVIFALIVIGGYKTVVNAINLGRQQTYAPDQPIKFSHATHAGLHLIDCQFCHDGARRSKHSVIPAANTCMKCHKAIKKGSTYGTAELTKIYASIGYDPSTDRYIENYEELSEGEIETIYKKWITDTYVKDNGTLDNTGQKLVADQWEGIKTSLTNDLKKNIQGPIEWIRIHNLPDHVYYNHSQHVNVGQLECQTCHGPVEEMEVVQQWSPLSMGWCVNCHRQTEVQFAGNEYYDSYEHYHQEIQEGTRNKVTVEEIGGLECQKCHY